MRHLQLTLDTLAENLALDEALLDEAERNAAERKAAVGKAAAGNTAEGGEIDSTVLRLWEAPDYGVVLGRSSNAEVEVNLDACRRDGVPVLRRSSGGGTILTGPGCLMYAVVLSFQDFPQLQAIDVAHEFVLSRLAQILTTEKTTENVTIQRAGTSDLTVRTGPSNTEQKFSGNALRVKQKHVLYHGTLLYDFDLERIPRWLATPTRTPDYRQHRNHANFVTNLAADRAGLEQKLIEGWFANEPLTTWPAQQTTNITSAKYTDDPKWVIFAPTS